ncbi:MAG TPA: Yip1 family protein, partial [Desulfuromonadaceae bacterium]|nr:Yip1 family protein [Desulfuromonadaceae bacterium]
LIFEPIAAWDRAARRSLKFTVLFYFVPMLLIVGAAEMFGLMEFGRMQTSLIGVKKFAFSEALAAEAAQMGLMVLIMLIATYVVKSLGETFHGKHNYTQAATVVIYGLSPVFLFRLLDLFPNINLLIPWGIGIMLTIKILYYGVPRVMQPDPPHALGLYFMTSLLLTMITAAERFVVSGYLAGKYRPVSEAFAKFVFTVAHKLHLQ